MNNKHNTDSWLFDTIKSILESEETIMKDHGLQFENTKAGAKLNNKLLKNYNYNYSALVKDHPNSTNTPGSKFRKPEILEKLFVKHEDWNFIKTLSKEGMDHPIKNDIVNDKKLREDLIYMIERGNHRSTLTAENKEEVEKVLGKETPRGWQFSIDVETVLKIVGTMYIPIGIADQITVDETGAYVPKKDGSTTANMSIQQEPS